jgi:hypothetical protein
MNERIPGQLHDSESRATEAIQQRDWKNQQTALLPPQSAVSAHENEADALLLFRTLAHSNRKKLPWILARFPLA